jgi:hypothetical protein
MYKIQNVVMPFAESACLLLGFDRGEPRFARNDIVSQFGVLSVAEQRFESIVHVLLDVAVE